MTEQRPHPHPSRRFRLRRRHVTVGSLIMTALTVILIALFNLDPAVRQGILTEQPGLVPVTHVNDGDTIIVHTGGRDDTVRLIGVDTPETKDPRKPVQCFGEAASAHTKAAIPVGSKVRLASDPADADRDKYGRLLRYVYLPDGTLYNEQLIQQGYGFAYVIFPFTKLDQFRADEAAAREANRGLWADCNIDSSSEIKQTTSTK